jgi:acyl-coenzyme A thioesterase PaaI-like protein
MMSEEEREPAVALAFAVRDDHWCFGCGADNPIGLKLRFFSDEATGRVWAPWTPERPHQGFEGIVHGGLITTVLDEVMGWVVYARNIWAVTGTLSVRFRKPVEIGVPTRAIAWVERDAGRKIDVAGELRRASDDLLLASATAIFIRVPKEQAAAWQGRYIDNPT